MRNDIGSSGPEKALVAGLVLAEGVRVAEAPPELRAELEALIAKGQWPDRKEPVRAMLRAGGFKPSGRNKPASEYLQAAARDGRFPFINNLVDVNNFVSLQSSLPISMLDVAALGPEIVLRHGRASEKYVFNAGGQEIDLEGLVCVCRAPDDAPLGNPVKDSLAGKIKEHTNAVLGIVYASRAAIGADELAATLKQFAGMIEKYGGGTARAWVAE